MDLLGDAEKSETIEHLPLIEMAESSWHEFSELPLYECLDKDTKLFLKITGMWWTKNSFQLSYFWNIFILGLAVSFFVANTEYSITYPNFIPILDSVPLFIQCVGFVVATFRSYKKMVNKVMRADLALYPGCIWVCRMTVLACFGTSIPLFCVIFLKLWPGWVEGPILVLFVLFAFCFLAQSFIIAGNLLFLMVDAKVAIVLINRLQNQFDRGVLTLDYFNQVRNEIEQRVNESASSNNMVMLVALLNVAFLLVISIFTPAVYMIIPIAVFMREVIYVLVGFWFIAIVNETSDKLTEHFGTSISCNSGSTSACEGGGLEKEHLRLQLFANSLARPISFNLAGMRLKRADVAFRLSVWLVGVVVALLKDVLWVKA